MTLLQLAPIVHPDHLAFAKTRKTHKNIAKLPNIYTKTETIGKNTTLTENKYQLILTIFMTYPKKCGQVQAVAVQSDNWLALVLGVANFWVASAVKTGEDNARAASDILHCQLLQVFVIIILVGQDNIGLQVFHQDGTVPNQEAKYLKNNAK